MSSASVQWMLRGRLRSHDLNSRPSHAKEMARDNAARGMPCSSQRGNAGRVRCCLHPRLDAALEEVWQPDR